MFNTINNFLEENGIKWKNCTDGPQPMCGRNEGLQVLVRKKTVLSGHISSS
jgi:hypothetical protein